MTTVGKATLGVLATIAVVVGALIAMNVPPNVAYWGSDERVVAHLKSQTPLGTPLPVVTAWLRKGGLNATYNKAYVSPGSDYPQTKVGGSGFIHTSIAEYGWPFAMAIEAFYIFDVQGDLRDITIRRTVDAF